MLNDKNKIQSCDRLLHYQAISSRQQEGENFPHLNLSGGCGVLRKSCLLTLSVADEHQSCG